MLRTFNKNTKPQGFSMIFLVFSFIGFIIWSQFYILWEVLLPKNQGQLIMNIIFGIIFFFFIWSFLTAILTDPGRVPLYWGFFLDDPEHKKRRYCLICHIFKPERCHHCSACNRCVLNMDHHCPWINNCVGFYNRKFFILMLFYSIMMASCLIVISIIGIIQLIEQEFQSTSLGYFDEVIVLIGLISTIIYLVIICMFFKFHIVLICQNSTTIENLDQKRNPNNKLNFDLGQYFNLAQVMGKNYLLWPFPIFLKSGRPVGDGVLWPQKQKQINTTQD